MTGTATLISAFIVAVILFAASAIGSYWQERSDGYSHTASLKASSILLALLFSNAVIDFVVSVAKFY